MENNDAVQKAIRKRDEFLSQNPHLQEFQKELDKLLDETTPDLRLETLSMMMTGKLIELQVNLMITLEILHEIRIQQSSV